MNLYHVLSLGNSPILKINHIGFSRSPQVNRFGLGQRDLWLIHYVTKGKGYFNGHPVHAGEGFLINRGQKEIYFPDKDDPWEFLWITSNDDTMRSFFEKYPINPDTQIFSYKHISTIENIMSYIQSHHNEILSSEQILEMFLHIFNSHIITKERVTNADEYYAFAIQYIDTRLHTPIKIKALADAIGISTTYLLELFKERIGISPKQYINRQRINMSKIMLRTTEFSITEIARSVGYDDVLSFSRFFSKEAHISPSDYRKRARK